MSFRSQTEYTFIFLLTPIKLLRPAGFGGSHEVSATTVVVDTNTTGMSVVNTYQILLMSRRSSHRMGLLCALTLSSAALGSIPATLSFSPCTMTTCQTWSTHKDVPRTRSRRRRRPREVVEPPRCSPSASGSTSSSSGAGGRDEGNTGEPFVLKGPTCSLQVSQRCTDLVQLDSCFMLARHQ